MDHSNLGICNDCLARVPAEFFERDGQAWIRKDCPKCGVTEAMVSTDAAAWLSKRELWNYTSLTPEGCSLNCDTCRADHHPNMIFLDVTNRCNMNCPICIATIRYMKFDFNPPLEYFEKIFTEVGKMHPKPVVMLFGGEPTVRNDLLDIIKIARKHGLRPHVTTNGLRLADEEYCKTLCEARVSMRFGFDGRAPEIYEKLRGNRGVYDKKMKALENLKKYSRRKHSIISCAAWGINDQYMADLLQYCHDNRDLISDIGIIPLTENWEEDEFKSAVPSTMEDVEKMVCQSIPGGEVEFIPAGLSYCAKLPRSFFRDNPRSEVLLLAGVHPNCESMTLLISDGKTYRGINHYLKRPFRDVVTDFAALSDKIAPKLTQLDPKKFFQRHRGRLLCIRTFTPWFFRSVDLQKLAGGNAFLGLLKAGVSQLVRHFKKKIGKGRRPRRILRVAILPFEEQHSIDAGRLEKCKAAFAYEDVADGEVKYIPACLWYPYRNDIMKKLSEKYGVAGGKTKEEAELIGTA